MEKLLTVREVSEFLRLKPGTIRKMVQRNRIPCYRFSKYGKPRFSETELMRWMEKQKNGGKNHVA